MQLFFFIQFIEINFCNSSWMSKKIAIYWIEFCSWDIARETQVSLIQIYDQECERMRNFLLVAVVCKETSPSCRYRSANSPLTLCEDSKMAANFSLVGSRENFHVASSVRNLTEIGLEIPREGRVNFRHLVVPSARRQKSYFRQKSSYLERTIERSHHFIKKGNAIWIAFVTNMTLRSKSLVKL